MYKSSIRTQNTKVSAAVMFAALTLLFLYIADVAPIGRIIFYFICSAFIFFAMLEGMVIPAFISFGVVFFLGYLILPDKAGMLPYLFFFGHYGIFKSVADGGGGRSVALKLVYFNIGMTLVYFFGGRFLTAQLPAGIPIWIVWLVGNGLFLAYDFLLSRVAAAYMRGLRGKLLGSGQWM